MNKILVGLVSLLVAAGKSADANRKSIASCTLPHTRLTQCTVIMFLRIRTLVLNMLRRNPTMTACTLIATKMYR